MARLNMVASSCKVSQLGNKRKRLHIRLICLGECQQNSFFSPLTGSKIAAKVMFGKNFKQKVKVLI